MNGKSILHRVSLRGLAKCKACGHYNGIRAMGCKNKSCTLFKIDVKRKDKPKLHAVHLITKDEAQLYSVQIKDRDSENRNFVSITDKIISSDANGTIISRNAICYVDTCKYDSNDINISCKHVKSSLEQCSLEAEALTIDPNILISIRLSKDTKHKLKTILTTTDLTIPLVQRILPTMFVARCDLNANFPAGLLHVLCCEDGTNATRCLCACKKPKQPIIIDHTNFKENHICVHVLLVLVAIWSNKNRFDDFKGLLASIEFLFNYEDNCILIHDINNINDSNVYGCLENTTNEFVDNLDTIEMIQVPSDLTTTCNTAISLNTLDCECVPVIEESNENADNGLEFVNYRVELMNPVDVNEEILSTEHKSDYIGLDGIYDVADINSWTIDGHEYSQFGESDVFVDELLGSSGSVAQNSVIAMKNCDSKTVTGMRSESILDNDIGYEQMLLNLDASELRMFNNWMESMIEKINSTMDFNDDGHPQPIVFSVPHLYFEILRAKFSVGTKKKRLPNQTFQISDGKYKGLALSNWIFSNLKLIKLIFTTDTIELEPVRLFDQASPNTFRHIDAIQHSAMEAEQQSNQFRKIRPTIYKTFLKTRQTETNTKGKDSKAGLFSIEWIQNVLPKAQYGEMRIKLQFGHMKNDIVL